MTLANSIRFTFAMYNVAPPPEIETMPTLSVKDDRLFLIDTTSPIRVASELLPKPIVDQVMTDVLQTLVFGMQKAFKNDDDGTTSDLLQGAIEASSGLDYRFSTKDAPDLLFDYAQLLTEFNRLRAEIATSGTVELYVFLQNRRATRLLLKLLGLDAASVKSTKLTAYVVGATVKGALQSNGARGNVFKFLQKHVGYYSEQEGIKVLYEEDDFAVKAYFLASESASHFQNALYEWEIHKDLLNFRGVNLDPLTPIAIKQPPDLQRIYLHHYKPLEFESPCQSLNQLHSYHVSVPQTTEVDATAPVAKYQCMDKQMPGFNPYKCHLKDKDKFKSLQGNENNMVAASWQLHQLIDGLNSREGLPIVALSVASVGQERSAQHDNRVPLTLRLEFSVKYFADIFQGNNTARRENDMAWQTVVYVTDPKLFGECIAWKYEDTTRRWAEHEHFLNEL